MIVAPIQRLPSACTALLLAPLVGAPSDPPPAIPFSEAVRAGDVLYLSGQIGIAPGESAPVSGGMSAEARQAMDNIGRVLRAHGLNYSDVVRCLVMLGDMDRWAEFNQVYGGYFQTDRLPARSAMEVSGLAFEASVEVECTAHFPSTIRTLKSGETLGPYAQATIAGGFIFASGVIAYDPVSHRMAEPDISAQMALILVNLDAVLKSAGASRTDIVKTNVYLRNPADMPAMNTAYAGWFTDHAPPAHTTVLGADWGRADILVEVEAIALTPEGARQ